jgi:hypothetical protein
VQQALIPSSVGSSRRQSWATVAALFGTLLFWAAAAAGPARAAEAPRAAQTSRATQTVSPQVRVGVGRADITPVTGVFKGGWSCTCAEAIGQQERLYARAVVIDEGGQKVALRRLPVHRTATPTSTAPASRTQQISTRSPQPPRSSTGSATDESRNKSIAPGPPPTCYRSNSRPSPPVRTHPLNAGRVQGAREHATGEFDAPGASRATESCKQYSSIGAAGTLAVGIGQMRPPRTPSQTTALLVRPSLC